MRHFKKTGAGYLIHLSRALVESLRMELAGTDIKISVIEPGVTLTELHDNIPVHPMKALNIARPLQPEDIAAAIRFMLEQPCHVRIPVMMVLPGEQSI
jgi:NADP-dependent 3-hydroxy acid dehydrogenase YdfG